MQPINSGGEHDTVHDGHDVLKRTVRLSAAAIISSNGLIWMRQNQRFLNGVSNSKLMSFSSHNVKMKAFTALSLRHGPHVRRALSKNKTLRLSTLFLLEVVFFVYSTVVVQGNKEQR